MRLCLIGYGNVGYGFIRVLLRHSSWLRERFGFSPKIVALHDLRRGTALSPSGLDLRALAKAWEENHNLSELGESPARPDAFFVIQESQADAVLELTPTDLSTGERFTTQGPPEGSTAYSELLQLLPAGGVAIQFQSSSTGSWFLTLWVMCFP